MNIIVVDDEIYALEELKEVIESVRSDANIKCFDNYIEALNSAKEEKYDIAFLDISMPGITGLDLSQKFKELNKNINIIFVTGYSEYAVDAFSINASGYILKPAKKSDVQNALDNLRIPINNKSVLKIQCFGNFEVFYDDMPVKFNRKLTKEVLAYLVHLKGAVATTGEICGVLFGDKSNESSSKHYFRNLISDLRATLEKYGCGDVFVYNRNSFSIDINKVDCDYYKYLKDNNDNGNYMGEFMKQYSWAEDVNGYLIHNNKQNVNKL